MNLLEAYKCNKYIYITNAITVQLDIIGSKYIARMRNIICTISTILFGAPGLFKVQIGEQNMNYLYQISILRLKY